MATVPNERLRQYTDRNGHTYVACFPDEDSEPWFQKMIDEYGLLQLVDLFPYQTLVLNPETGFTETSQPCRYNAKITNGFHLLLAQLRDTLPPPESFEGYKLRLAEAYPDHDEPEVRDVSPPTPSDFVQTEQDGYQLNLEDVPETIKLPAVKGWHPNRDASGNYLSAQQYQYSWNPYYNPYPGGFNPYSQGTYLPTYQKPGFSYDGYPF